MSEFRKDMRKDIGNKKIAIVQSLVEVSGFIANLIDIIDGHSNEIDRLTAELAAKDEWTPITSVEQVEGLQNGYYELKRREPCVYHDKFALAIKNKNVFNWFSKTDMRGCYHEKEIQDKFESYKLIRAFKEEPAAPSIPEGAIEKTLENRLDVDNGWYYFQGSGHALYRKTDPRWWVNLSGQCINSDSLNFKDFTYFTKTTELDILAALEALAKGKR